MIALSCTPRETQTRAGQTELLNRLESPSRPESLSGLEPLGRERRTTRLVKCTSSKPSRDLQAALALLGQGPSRRRGADSLSNGIGEWSGVVNPRLDCRMNSYC